MTNREIAKVLREMSAYYEMESIPFKPAAYERAASAVGSHPEEAAALFAAGGRPALRAIPGVGEGIAAHIESLLAKGSFKEYAAFRKKYPLDLDELTSLEGVGPKTAKALFTKLGVRTLADLEKAARDGRIGKLPRFGSKSEEKILKSLELKRHAGDRRLLGDVLPLATRLAAALEAVPGVRQAVPAGSVRRRQETIGDLDILVATDDPESVVAVFTGFPEVAEVLEHGPTLTAVRLKNGLRADVRLIPFDSWGAALQHFTGGKEHNVELRKYAIEKGFKLNEYGLWRGGERLASRTEADVYAALGLPYIEPEIRTASGEIEAALAGRLPALIPYGSLRGDLQVQTAWTDGGATIAGMAAAARKLKLEYVAVTDHSRTLAMAGGLDEKKLAEQGREIDRLNAAAPDNFRVLKGAEVNILKDGRLDLDPAALAALDVVGAAVHSHFTLSRAEQTRRVLAAVRDPNVDIIFHPTGRLIGRRDPYDLDIDEIFKEAARTGTALEIDAVPERTDLRDTLVRRAVGLGVKLVIDSDAHLPAHLQNLDLGVAVARRGWAEKKDVLNTRSLPDLKKWLKSPKSGRK